jgi:hypothetical protein
VPKWNKGNSEQHKQFSRDKYMLEKELEEPVKLDELELEKYIEFVVKEVRKSK